jgi:hypothetical protein
VEDLRSEAISARGAVVVTVPRKLRQKIGDDESEELVSLINSVVLSNIATKADLASVATKADLAEVKAGLVGVQKEVSGLMNLMIGLWAGQFLAFCALFAGFYLLVLQILR